MRNILEQLGNKSGREKEVEEFLNKLKKGMSRYRKHLKEKSPDNRSRVVIIYKILIILDEPRILKKLQNKKRRKTKYFQLHIK